MQCALSIIQFSEAALKTDSPDTQNIEERCDLKKLSGHQGKGGGGWDFSALC